MGGTERPAPHGAASGEATTDRAEAPMAETGEIMKLSTEDGDEVDFTMLDTIEYQGDSYIVLVPLDEDEEGDDDGQDGEETDESDGTASDAYAYDEPGDDGDEVDDEDDEGDADDEDDDYDEYDGEETVEVVILKVVPGEDGDEDEYETVDDDETLDALFELFHDRHVGEYEFE